MSKKILAALLAVLMVVSLMPVTAMAAGEQPDVIRAPLGDTTNTYQPNLLNIDGYEVTYEEDPTIIEGVEDVTAYNVAVTHSALLKHSNDANPQVSGLWVGIGVKITTEGTDGKSGDGSSYFAFVTDKTNFSEIAGVFKEKDWAGQGVPGYSEYGWRAHENGYVFQWYNLADERYEGMTPYLVERNPKEESGYTYKAYKLDFDVTEGHLVKYQAPLTGSLSVEANGQKVNAAGTPVAKGTELTITATPENEYFTVKAVKAGDTALTAESDGIYKTTVNADVTISVEFDTASEATGIVSAPAVQDVPDTITGNNAALAESVKTELAKSDAASFDNTVMQAAAAKEAAKSTETGETGLTKLQSSGITNSEVTSVDNASGVNIAVLTYMDISITDAISEDGSTGSVTLDIQPRAKTIATVKDPEIEAEGIVILDEEKTNAATANAVELSDEEITIDSPTDVSLKLPDGFLSDNTYTVEHEKSTGQKYYYDGRVSSNVLTFTSQHGFSEFTIPSAVTPVAEVNGTKFATLEEAIANVNGGTIILLEDNLTATVNTAMTFTVKSKDGESFTAAITAGSSVNMSTETNEEDGSITYTFTPKGGGSGSIGGGSTGTSGNITVTKPANGSMTSNVTTAKEGDKVTVTVKPDAPYYIVTGVTVKGDKGTVTATKNADGTYSFTMPAGTVSVSATIVHMYDLFTDISSAVSSIPEYGTAIKWAVEQGITVGTSTSTFSPYNPCTRAQMVVFLYRAAGSPAVSGTNSFTDVPSDNEIQKAVQWAVNKNITQGTSATTFDPYAPCTRAQMVTFLHRNNGEAAATGSNNFADVPVDAYYRTAIQWAVNEGITKGYSDTAFGPSDACTRVQMVTFLYRDMAK